MRLRLKKGFVSRPHEISAMAKRGLMQWRWSKKSQLKVEHTRGKTVGATKGCNVDESDIKDASAKVNDSLNDEFDSNVGAVENRAQMLALPKSKKTKEEIQKEKQEQQAAKDEDCFKYV